MGIGWHLPAKGVDQGRLACGIGQMVVAPDHMGYAHIVVIDHNSQHIGWRVVGAEQDEIVNLTPGGHHRALHLIVHADELILAGCTQAGHIRCACRRICPIRITPRRTEGEALGPCRFF